MIDTYSISLFEASENIFTYTPSTSHLFRSFISLSLAIIFFPLFLLLLFLFNDNHKNKNRWLFLVLHLIKIDILFHDEEKNCCKNLTWPPLVRHTHSDAYLNEFKIHIYKRMLFPSLNSNNFESKFSLLFFISNKINLKI